VLLALDAVHDPNGEPRPGDTMLYASNDRVQTTCARHGDAFLFGASVHPYRADALDELDRVASLGAVLVKLLPNSQAFDPAAPRLLPYWRKLADLDLPLLIHCGFEHTLPAIDQAFGDPARLVPCLEEGATVIVAHGGSAGRFHARETFGGFLRLLERFPRCYGDTSALANWWRSKYLFELLDPDTLARRYGVKLEAPFDRFVHGSDFPVPSTPFAFSRCGDRRSRAAARASANPLDLDIALKRLAGVPNEVLSRAAKVLRLPRKRISESPAR